MKTKIAIIAMVFVLSFSCFPMRVLAQPSYYGIADYYDDRRAVVTVTADDYQVGQEDYFDVMGSMLMEKHIYFTGAINSGLDGVLDSPDWGQIQSLLDQGYLEAGSHSRTHPLVYPDYDSEIGGCKADIIGNLTLPSFYSYGDNEYVYSWIEPWGYSNDTLREKVGEYRYLCDRGYPEDGIYDWVTWDSSNGLFNRVGYSIQMEDDVWSGTIDPDTLNGAFDVAYSSGGIYHLFLHPDGVDWSEGEYADEHTTYISNKTDVWYVPFGLLYLYHWIDTQDIVEVDPLGDNVFQVSIDSDDRDNYGAKYPVTYVFDIPPDWSDPTVNYRFQIGDSWKPMDIKTSSDFFNGVNAVRFDLDNNKAYVSIGFDNISNDIYLQINDLTVNTPPEASNLAITPGSPLTTDDLVGSYDYYDADGNPESGSEIRWYKDTDLQPGLNNSLTVSSSLTATGEEWYFTVTPNDGIESGTLQTSPTVTISSLSEAADLAVKGLDLPLIHI